MIYPKFNKTSILGKHIHAIITSGGCLQGLGFLIACVLLAVVLVLNTLLKCHQLEVEVDQDLLISLDLIDLLFDLVQLLLLLSLVHVKLSQDLLLLDDVVLVLLGVLVGSN